MSIRRVFPSRTAAASATPGRDVGGPGHRVGVDGLDVVDRESRRLELEERVGLERPCVAVPVRGAARARRSSVPREVAARRRSSGER